MKKREEGRSLRELYALHLQLGFTLALALVLGLFLTVRNLDVAPLKPSPPPEYPGIFTKVQIQDVEEPLPPQPRPSVDEVADEIEEGPPSEAVSETPDITPPPLPETPLAAPAPPAPTEPVPYYKLEVKPRLIHRVIPRYPELARRMGLEGRVVVNALVGEDGRVLQAEVVKASPPEIADILGPAAVEAVLQFRFSPGMQQDRPVRVWVAVPVDFRLQ